MKNNNVRRLIQYQTYDDMQSLCNPIRTVWQTKKYIIKPTSLCPLPIRLSFAIEEQVYEPTTRLILDNKRNRSRKVFKLHKVCALFLTKIDLTTYEVEVELSKEFNGTQQHIQLVYKACNSVCKNFLYPDQDHMPSMMLYKELHPRPVKPVIFNYDNLKVLPVFITPKVDGIYTQCMINKDTLYVIKDDIFIAIDNIGPSQWYLTVLDTEYKNGRYYVFDISIARGEDVRMLPFHERLKLMTQIKGIKHVNVKKYSKVQDHTSFILALKNSYVKVNKELVDGFILVKYNQTYYEPCYKWKDNPSVDLFFSDNKLYACGQDDMIVFNFEFGDVPCNNKICEFIVSDKLIFHRIRDDKEKPNSLYVVKQTILSGSSLKITIDDLLGKTSSMFRYCNRTWKHELIKTIEGNTLDIGVGSGNDVHNFMSCIDKLFVIENNENYYRRLESFKYGNRLVIYRDDALSIIPYNEMKTCSIQNVCLFYSINQIANIDIITYNINEVLCGNGNVYIIMFDCSSMSNIIGDGIHLVIDDKVHLSLDGKHSSNIVEDIITKEKIVCSFKSYGFDLIKQQKLPVWDVIGDNYKELSKGYILLHFAI
jgi:hypothetical protein